MRTTALGPPPLAGRFLSIANTGRTCRPCNAGLAQLPVRSLLNTSDDGSTKAEKQVSVTSRSVDWLVEP